MDKLIDKLEDLHKQATEEKSHYYVGSVVRETIDYLTADKDAVADVLCNDGLLRLLKEMKTETNEYLVDYINDLGELDGETCELIVSRLADFFNRKIYDIERKQ